MRNDKLKFLLVLTIVFGAAVGADAQRIKAVRDADSNNILTVKKAGADLPSGDLADAVEKDGAGKSTLTMSADNRYDASVVCVSARAADLPGCVHRVFVGDLQTDENYQIDGEEHLIESRRPVDNLKWINAHTLSYDRWVSPHFGHRYVVDIKTMKQTDAFTLSDQ
jgi:hypothetical protein